MARALMLISLVFALAGCSSPEKPEARTGFGGPSTGSRQVTLPSKNIGCLVTADSARCDINSKTFKPPAKPADCKLAWGNAVTVTAEDATLTCAGDTVMGSAEILEYGEDVQIGDFVCTSASSGVRCTHAPTGRGFTLAREAYTLF